MVLFSVVVVLLGTGVISVSDALAGFSNRGMITVALLFLVSEGIRASECLKPIMRGLFPSRSDSISRSYAAILPAVAAISAFVNNTPLVVIFIPLIKAWCRQVGVSV